MNPIRVLLIEDHLLMQDRTRHELYQLGNIEIVGDTANENEGIDLAVHLQPDIVVIDIHIPRVNGVEIARQIKENAPLVKILVLAEFEGNCFLFPLLGLDEEGYLFEMTSGMDLDQAIHAAMRSETSLTTQANHKATHISAVKQTLCSESLCGALTDREADVLHAAAQGKSNKEIALQLSISTGTVQVHLRNIYCKMKVSSRTEAVTSAISQGWISLDSSEL